MTSVEGDTNDQPMLILTRGIPASGKTSWAKAWVAESPSTRLRVNRDDLRRMLHGVSFGLTFGQEENITAVQQVIVRDAIATGKSVVVDDMNLRARYAKGWFKFADDVWFQDFPVETEEAVARDAQREHSVGADVIRSIASKFTREGVIVPAPIRESGEHLDAPLYIPDLALDPAYIVDVDGTLAHIPAGGRSPYDGARVHEDTLDEAVAAVVATLGTENQIIIMSGRDEEFREATEAWLIANGVHFDALFMRPAGDRRKDHIVKLELFDAHVRNRYNVKGVFDDRNRVVEMWRSIGLKCFHVQEGNF